jgi:hypothetical protein
MVRLLDTQRDCWSCSWCYKSSPWALRGYHTWISCTKSEVWTENHFFIWQWYSIYFCWKHSLSFCREQFDTWQLLLRARNEGRLFSKIFWPNDPEMVLILQKKTKNLLAVMLLLVCCFCLSLQKEQVKRLHLLLTVKDSAANIPKNLEARRRLQFFTNSLFMDMPAAKPVSEMIPFRYY